MGRFPQHQAAIGSQKWVQKVVNETSLLPDAEIRNHIVLPAHESISWLSPRAEDGYAEYRDQASFSSPAGRRNPG